MAVASQLRAPRARPIAADALLAVVLALVGVVELAADPPDSRLGVAVAAVLVATLPLAWRRAAPLRVAFGTTAGLVSAVALLPEDQLGIVGAFAPLVALYTVGELHPLPVLARAGPALVVPWSALGLIEGDAGGVVLGMALAAGTLLVGQAVRVVDFETDVLERRVGVLELDQDERARAAVADERARIARELHDVIGHSISVMGIQAGAVRRVLPDGLDREREMLLCIERTGRDSVTEMRRLIELLRDGEGADDGALPTLARIPQLVEDVRAAGLDVALQVDGDLADVPPGRGVAAYRIVQEALTNVLKHAPGARVRLEVRRATDAIGLRVTSTGGTAAGGDGDGGQGLVGMRERAALYGGRLDAGPTPDGGFRVEARIPTEGE